MVRVMVPTTSSSGGRGPERAISVVLPCLDDLVFDVNDHLDELRCRPTSWLQARRDALVREQRRLRVEELAVIRVLDERGGIDETRGWS